MVQTKIGLRLNFVHPAVDYHWIWTRVRSVQRLGSSLGLPSYRRNLVQDYSVSRPWSGFFREKRAPPPPPPKTATSVWSPQNELALIKYTKMLVLRWGFAWYCSNFVWYSASKDRRNVIKILVKQNERHIGFAGLTSKFHNCDLKIS